MATICPRFCRIILISRTDFIVSLSSQIIEQLLQFLAQKTPSLDLYSISAQVIESKCSTVQPVCYSELLGRGPWWTAQWLAFLAGDQEQVSLLLSPYYHYPMSCSFHFYLCFSSISFYTPTKYSRDNQVVCEGVAETRSLGLGLFLLFV